MRSCAEIQIQDGSGVADAANMDIEMMAVMMIPVELAESGRYPMARAVPPPMATESCPRASTVNLDFLNRWTENRNQAIKPTVQPYTAIGCPPRAPTPWSTIRMRAGMRR